MEKPHRITYRFDNKGNRIENKLTNNQNNHFINSNRRQENLELRSEQSVANDSAALQELEQFVQKKMKLQTVNEVQETPMKQFNQVESSENDRQEEEMVYIKESDPLNLQEEVSQLEQLIKGYDNYDDREVLEERKNKTTKRLEREDTYDTFAKHNDEVKQASEHVVYKQEEKQQDAIRSLNWVRSALSVIGAIVSGCLIGYLFLALIFGIHVWPLSSILGSYQKIISAEGSMNSDKMLNINMQQSYGQTSNDLNNDKQQNLTNQDAVQAGNMLSLPPQSYQYYVLQAGVFTKQDTRDEVIARLQQAGYAAEITVDDSNRYVVYAGLAASTNEAEYVQGRIKNIETYRKQLTLTLPQQLPFNGDAELLDQYFQTTNHLITMYADLVSAQFEQSKFSAINKAAESAWQDHYKHWLAISEQALPLWGSMEDAQFASNLQEALQQADNELLSYQTEPKSKYLWNVQQWLVKAVVLQKDWFEQANGL